MLVYYFVPFIVSNRYLLFWVSNGHNSVTVQNRTHVYMNFFDHKDLGNHLLQLCTKVVKHPVYIAKNCSYFLGTCCALRQGNSFIWNVNYSERKSFTCSDVNWYDSIASVMDWWMIEWLSIQDWWKYSDTRRLRFTEKALSELHCLT